MISRQWRGLAKASQAGAYIEQLRKDTLPQLRRIAGFVDAAILQRGHCGGFGGGPGDDDRVR